MTSFDYNPTTRVLFGKGKLKELAPCVKALQKEHILLVTDVNLVQAGHVARAAAILDGISRVTIFDQVKENPSEADVKLGVAFAKQHGPFDSIVALGGGSAMDCAKGINFLLSNGGRMADYHGFGKASKPMLPAIGIPATAGTGSEAQSFALISKAGSHEKMACGDVKARFAFAILDPEVAVTAPRPVKAMSGLDAISHVVESYVSTRQNPVSRMFGREAWRLLNRSYERFLELPDDLNSAGDMLLGAHFAGAAIENSMLGAAHACANPLTARFGVAHGMAVGVMLPHVVRFNCAVVNGDYDELLADRTVRRGDGGVALAEKLTAWYEANGWPGRLREFGVEYNALRLLAEDAASQWTGTFNPRTAGVQEFLELYNSAY